MTDAAHSIDIDLAAKLRDPGYRQKFFLAESSARIAAQLIALRKRRGLNQKDVASLTGTRQPAISRAEQADYQNWSFNTLRSIADALDARIRVLIEPSEDILGEYEPAPPESGLDDAEQRALRRLLEQSGRTRAATANEKKVMKLQDEPSKPLEYQRSRNDDLLGENLKRLIEGAQNAQRNPSRLGEGPDSWR